MPIELHPRPKKSDTPSKLKKTIIAAVIIMIVVLVRSFAFAAEAPIPHTHEHLQTAQELKGPGSQAEYPFGCEFENSKTKGPSYYNYGHCNYHDAFYKHLRKWSSKDQSFSDSCCSGKECRVTAPLDRAPPEFLSLGFTHMVKVDGDWYPINLVEKQTSFTPDQFAEVKAHPLFHEFLGLTHVCASEYIVPTEEVRRDPVEYRAHLLQKTNSIYCVLDGGDKS